MVLHSHSDEFVVQLLRNTVDEVEAHVRVVDQQLDESATDQDLADAEQSRWLTDARGSDESERSSVVDCCCPTDTNWQRARTSEGDG